MFAREPAVTVHVGCCVFLHQQIADFFQSMRQLVQLGKH